MTKRILYILAIAACCWACVGRQDDPDIPEEPQENEEPGGSDSGKHFYHRILALEFTGTWCQYCPNMAEALVKAKSQRPGRIVDIAVHYGDDMTPPIAETLIQRFMVSAFPTALFDLNSATRFTRQDASQFTTYVDKTVPAATCGIALKSMVKDGKLSLTFSVQAVQDGTYAAAVALVEDGIIAAQTGASSQFVHNSVLRGFLNGGIDGCTFGDMKAGEERTLTFTTTLNRPAEALRIVAYVLKDGKTINADSCSLNEICDYVYEPDA